MLAGNLDSYTRLLCTLGMLVLFIRYIVRYIRELDRSFPFWYKGHLLILYYAVKDHREDIYISSISLYLNILKQLIKEYRENYLNNIDKKITIFKHREGD
ncbi:hypothetical protein N7537_010172 [Penicillium hordei]|uniref:BCS1 N-terminal domain-containing protein n=1 Tax=Penicillium hordei TaxID=40994 RepID=A0AAD6DU59_9EURO|nr:uncharacterized protein N7537_010172 [Penicillium hordei]KAJ5593268.1 hypothetical protein N7537_010172 [Penicillium hordei]